MPQLSSTDATDAPADDVGSTDEQLVGDDGQERFRPSWIQVVALVVAVAFLTGVVTTWWANREPTPNAVDVGFYDDMTTHHDQAIGMAITYLSHGTDPVLRFVAGKINASQNGDNRQMFTALQEWGKRGTPDVAMEWMNMPVRQDAQPGMATQEQLDELEKARGRRLDDLFSRMMIDHHQGGIHMAEAAASRGDLSRGLATYMATSQRSEIGELNTRRQQLGLAPYQP
jgi:uncharacterized protein (DUF305 family)